MGRSWAEVYTHRAINYKPWCPGSQASGTYARGERAKKKEVEKVKAECAKKLEQEKKKMEEAYEKKLEQEKKNMEEELHIKYKNTKHTHNFFRKKTHL